MGFFLHRLRPVVRRLTRSPMFTAITLITLGVGIGANTAIFSVLNGVLLKPLPYPNSDQLVGVWETAPGLGLKQIEASPATYFTFREGNRTLQDIGLWRNDSVNITGLGEPEQVNCLMISDAVLPILGVQPIRGRWFSRKDDSPGSPETVMLEYGYWQRKFGGDESVIGRRILVDGEAREVIGIMPRTFGFMDRNAAMILPFQLDRNKAFIGNFSYRAVARLKPGVTIAQANADEARMLPIMMRKFAPAPGMSVQMLEQARLGPNLGLARSKPMWWATSARFCGYSWGRSARCFSLPAPMSLTSCWYARKGGSRNSPSGPRWARDGPASRRSC